MTDIWNLPNNISSIYIGQKEIQSIVQTSDSTVLYQKSQSHTYVLTVQLSFNTIYTDGSTVISGVLTDNGSAMANETITIYDGNTSLGTCTTDSNGAYSKTLSGFNSGTHTLKASHTNIDSSNVTLTVNNHTYAISVSANPVTISSGQSSIISATLTRDGIAYSGQTVTFSYNGNSYISTTDTNGVATYTYTGTGIGSVTITASSNNVSDTVTITDNPSGGSTPSSISISATKDVLSAYHGDTCTLTATVLDNNNNPCSGETVTFKKGSTVLGTDTTDANGKAEYIYVATGVGDVTITVECSLLSEIYELEDCIYAHLQQIDIARSGTPYHYLTGEVISNLPTTYSIDFDMKTSTTPQSNAEQRIYWSPKNLWNGSSQPSEALFIGYCYESVVKYEFGKRLNNRTSNVKKTGVSINTWDTVRFEKVNDSSAFYGYLNSDTAWDYWTLNNAKNYSEWVFGVVLWSDTTFSVKNMKIKPL